MGPRIQKGDLTQRWKFQRLEAPLVILNVLEDFGDAAKFWRKHDPIVKEYEKDHDALLAKYKKVAAKERSQPPLKQSGHRAMRLDKY